ncbi:MAG: hypothetical protein KIT69_09455 [Propionibacteriaceae bacterium]|nr:hypothetical protein [Propionibacteriaceae bacterium]
MSDPSQYDTSQPLRATSAQAPAVPTNRRIMDHKLQPKQARKGPIPARQANGYYADHETGDRLRSVTTILSGGIPKEALVHWAGKVAAEAAMEMIPALVAASRSPAQLAEHQKWIAKAHLRKKDERAEVGHAVHAIIESRLLGTPLPASVEVNGEQWALDGPELAPYLANFARFEQEWDPVWHASEMVVANPTIGYAGTLDYLIASTGPIGDALRARGYQVPEDTAIMGDTKTGGGWITPEDGGDPHPKILSSGHVHGVYPEAGLQMSAYAHAEVCWLRDGSRVPMPPVAPVGVILHLRPEGYRLYPARCGDLEFVYFRYAQMIDEWSSRISSAKAPDPVIGKALAPASSSSQKAA